MAAFIELIAKIKQKNNGTFKLVDAQDVECNDGKGLDEVLNEKLDENQGVENVGKTMVVGADGNLVIGDSSPKNVYTKEEVDYLLNDKMDKPYYSIAITDDTTIENTLAGNFKMDSIEGSIYQAEESGIVPTPERPVPINSRKVLANGEYIELRSLKETSNVWDYMNLKGYDGEGILVQGWSSKICDLEKSFINLKPNTKYTVKIDIEMVRSIVDDTLQQSDLAKKLLLYRSNSTELGLPNVSISLGDYKNPMIDGEVQSITTTFTSPDDLRGITINGYSEIWGDGNNRTYNAVVKFKNIMIVEGESTPSTYVPPTIRDYKIVDHTNKTSKIVRNILEIDANNLNAILHTSNENYISFSLQISGMDGSTSPKYKLGYCSLFLTEEWGGLKNYEMFWIATSSMGMSISKTRNISDASQFLQFIKEKDIRILAKLRESTEESIPYLEDDTSEVGLSWQDTTSPSPDIPSKIYEVNEINIKLVNNNIFSGELEAGAYLTSDGTKTIIPNEKRYRCKDFVKLPSSKISYQMASTLFPSTSFWILYYDADKKYLGTYNHFDTIPNNAEYITFYCVDDDAVSYINTDKIMIVPYHSGLLNKITDYVEAKETSIQHTLSKPLRATKDGSIADTIDIVKSEATYKMVDLLKEYITIHGVYKKRTNTITFIIYNSNILHPTKTGITDTHINCNMFKVKAYNNDLDEEYICLYSEHPSYLFLSIDKKRLDVSGDEDTNVLKQKIQDYINTLDIKISYEASKPTTEPLEDELIQKLKTLKTFSPVTNVFVEGIAKPKLNAKYPKDIALAQQQLEQKILLMSETLTETQANLLLQGGQN